MKDLMRAASAWLWVETAIRVIALAALVAAVALAWAALKTAGVVLF